MRCCLVGLLFVAVACDSAPSQGSAIESIEKYKEGETPLQSREQVRYYAETEGRMHRVEKELKELRERVDAGLQLSSARQQALAALQEAVKAARNRIAEIRVVGASSWEAMRPSVDAAVAEVEARFKVLGETP